MNVSQQNIDKLNAVVKIEIAKADYQEKVDKSLRAYRQKANVPGFRKGMVPKGMIQKMFGKSVLIEEINKLVSEQLFGFIRENKLNILGEPLPSESQKEVNFDTQEDFEFFFDLALSPEIDVKLSKEDCIDYYNITIDEDMVKKQCEALAGRYGTQESVEVAGEKDMIKGTLTELDESGNVKENGIVVENAVVSPAYFKSDAEKAKFAGVKISDKLVFNPSASSEANATELASMLHISKEAAADVKSDFEMTVGEIVGFKPAEMGQELFDNVFGKDTVKNEEEYLVKVREMLAEQLKPESDYKFGIDARNALETKIGQIEFPEAFLKRWLVATGENRTAESVENEFPQMLPDLKWHLIKEQFVKNIGLKVEDADILEMAKKATRAQFAQYGMVSIPEDVLENYAKDMLKNKEAARNIVDRATEEKIVAAIKESVTLNMIDIHVEDFYKMFENK